MIIIVMEMNKNKQIIIIIINNLINNQIKIIIK
jgi:hypothetical protein